MVKTFLIFLLLISFSYANESTTEVVVEDTVYDRLDEKIKSFLDEEIYSKNKAYIKILFSPESDFITNRRVDSVKIVEPPNTPLKVL